MVGKPSSQSYAPLLSCITRSTSCAQNYTRLESKYPLDLPARRVFRHTWRDATLTKRFYYYSLGVIISYVSLAESIIDQLCYEYLLFTDLRDNYANERGPTQV